MNRRIRACEFETKCFSDYPEMEQTCSHGLDCIMRQCYLNAQKSEKLPFLISYLFNIPEDSVQMWTFEQNHPHLAHELRKPRWQVYQQKIQQSYI